MDFPKIATPVLCRPAVTVPEFTISLEETLALAQQLHENHEQLRLALRLIANTGVRTRHLVQPLTLTLQHPGFEARNSVYVRESRARVPAVVGDALANAELAADDIDAIVYVSCTGFTMPSM